MQKIGYLVILLLIIGIFLYRRFALKPKNSLSLEIASKIFTLEIADNPFLQAMGLSGRRSLCPNCGMLFIFNGEAIRTFWMKDTLIPLDMIFVKENGLITDIFTATPEPNTSDFKLHLYQSTQPVKYVIELNAGTSSQLQLQTGTYLRLHP